MPQLHRIWISESQERMVLSVPPQHWPELTAPLCQRRGEAAVLGTFEATGRLKLRYRGEEVADLDMHFLHDGRPQVVREARYTLAATSPRFPSGMEPSQALLAILGSPSVCSKEWIIRQYDHEVQAGSVIKPLVGVLEDGPSDAAVVAPILGDPTGLAIANGLNPRYADSDPWAAAACAIDEAFATSLRSVAIRPRTAILDNFCWGNVTDPDMLGALVRTSEACREVAIAYGTPFISGKDSLNNSFNGKDGRRISIPHTLLISALARVPDVGRCVSMDLKQPGNDLYLIGNTGPHLGGSHLNLVAGKTGGAPPLPRSGRGAEDFRRCAPSHQAGCIRSCHDLR